MSGYAYIGNELDLFARAGNWKSYCRSHLQPHIRGDVLEVGAGIGSMTRLLCDGTARRWVCLEPDAGLADRLRRAVALEAALRSCSVVTGTLLELDLQQRFDTLLYLDVIEHIEDDRAELERGADRLRAGGKLIVLAPAYQWLFTRFDEAIGHYRRYSKRTLANAVPTSLHPVALFYLDSVGLLAAAGNRLLLKQGMPSERQIRFWDRFFVPASRHIDSLLWYAMGKSVVGVWEKCSESPPSRLPGRHSPVSLEPTCLSRA